MTYGSLVKLIVANSVMVYPWMTYGSLVKLIVAYSVMVTLIDDIWVIGQHGEDEAGKQLFQDADDKGQLDAIFVLGMLLMAEGSENIY
uniref:Uncharacterized protein n=1 Tax=Lactuca sativa TaxID=4236 RepID=A0A9R1WE56_LACSA|nr:hypothetical protein LSAT_V11C200087490 [Lactuca sativa]